MSRAAVLERYKGKLNKSHMRDEEFVNKFKVIIDETFNSSFDTYVGLRYVDENLFKGAGGVFSKLIL